ncbi:FAD-binding oxidoreductase [Streptomyces tropicalis]|uniref:FAD-binding oxidoreductase n=1 Tax=Streptomyces tropicalis TaxID=3034234 RepID=A0ABT6A3F2_9ACTN|nr:FAD-binding oxidoreductase [Streptomyces tropicalis]MDF3298911.1 FAD-binding oxidoreductase [Streptomyces tropicalis]
MARAAHLGRLTVRTVWRTARLAERHAQTRSGRSLVFTVPGWPGHLPGQHLDVRLTADDGYQAVRSYSLAAPADGDRVELGVQAVPGGEVSPYLADELPVGAAVEMRGPLGNWFVWSGAGDEPVLLVAGGSGVVPLASMVRARRATGSPSAFHLLYSVRGPDELWYREDLLHEDPLLDVRIVYTRRSPQEADREPGRVLPADLRAPTARLEPASPAYVCGPTGFVESVADLLVGLGRDPATVRTERFG